MTEMGFIFLSFLDLADVALGIWIPIIENSNCDLCGKQVLLCLLSQRLV